MTTHGYENDPGYLASLNKIRKESMSGPYPEHFIRMFHQWNDGFQTAISDLIQHSARSHEAMVLLRPPPLANIAPWLLVLFRLQLPEQESRWQSSHVLKKPHWMTGDNLVTTERTESANEWGAVRAVCHIAKNAESYQAALVHLYTLASCTFRSQPLRPFMHGVLIFGTTLELWTFDRSGMYVSQAKDLRVDYLDAVSMIVGLSLMAPKDLGMDRIILKGEHTENLHIKVFGEILELREDAIVTPLDIFDDGLLCYYARRQNEQGWSYAVKFKWRSDFKTKEEEIFRVIRKKEITGIANLGYFHQLGSTATLRGGMRHQACRNLLESGKELRHGRGFEKYSTPTGFLFRNRTCMCFVFTPVGLPLSTFRGPSELLTVLRDVVQTHRDLLQKAGILHCDVSSSNILINEDTRRGMLIDFDVARDVSRGTPAGKSTAGTLEYMAVGLMRDDPHSYRHDLESLFYVFLYMVTCSKGYLPPTSRFVRWTADDWEKAVEARVEDMSRNNFARLLSEWDKPFASCKKLAWDLWRLLFQGGDELFWGTDTSKEATDALYVGFIEAFGKAIDGYEIEMQKRKRYSYRT